MRRLYFRVLPILPGASLRNPAPLQYTNNLSDLDAIQVGVDLLAFRPYRR